MSHALAGQYLGYKFIFLEAGSGAKKCIDAELIKVLKNHLEIPLIVGGGIIGCEMAQVFSRMGSKVYLVEMLEVILSTEDKIY